jgi:hypothetical protein
VVQQAQGRVRPTLQMAGGVAVNDERERERHNLGIKVMAAKTEIRPKNGNLLPFDENRVNQHINPKEMHNQITNLGNNLEPLQLKIKFAQQASFLNPEETNIDNDAYKETVKEAKQLSRLIEIEICNAIVGGAQYKRKNDGGTVYVRTVDQQNDTLILNRLADTGHEIRHGIDDLTKSADNKNKLYIWTNVHHKMRSEYNAFANEAAILKIAEKKGKPISQLREGLITNFNSYDDFIDKNGTAFARIKSYLEIYKITSTPEGNAISQKPRDEDTKPSDEDTTKYLTEDKSHIESALLLYKKLVGESDKKNDQ